MATSSPLGLIGGTGFERAFAAAGERVEVATPYGRATIWRARLGDQAVRFWSRHGEAHAVPPHRIPWRAGLWALRMEGVRRALATSAVGSLVPERLGPGALAQVVDAIDMTRGGRPQTFFDGPPLPVVHLDASRLYCPDLGRRLDGAAAAEGLGNLGQAVMVVTDGPRLETPAEIRAYARLGAEVVGMTGLPEAALARELGIAYAALAVVTNAAAGLGGATIDGAAIDRLARANQERVRCLFERVAAALGDAGERCSCCPAPSGAPPFPWTIGGGEP